MGCELFYYRQLFAGLLDLKNAVETRVSDNINIGNSQLSQQCFALHVLHKEMCEAFQYAAILPAIPLEKYLIGTENAAYAVGGNTTMLQDMEVVVPEFIFDEESHHGFYRAKETACIAYSV